MAVLSKLAGFTSSLKGKAAIAILVLAIIVWLKKRKQGGRKDLAPASPQRKSAGKGQVDGLFYKRIK